MKESLALLREAARACFPGNTRRALEIRLARLSARWLDRDDPFRLEAETKIPLATGSSPPMVRRALDLAFGALELGALGRLAGVREAPELTLVVAAGAIPDPIVRSVYRALLGKSAVLVKASSADPVLPEILSRSLARIDPGLGRCVMAARWAGGDRSIEDAVLPAVDRVIAYGSDEAIRDLAARVNPPIEFEGRGHKVSVALVGREALAPWTAVEDLARRLALDATLYDQAGCLSPQAVYVETGGAASVREVAAALALHLERLARSLPARTLDASTASEVHAERARYELRGFPLWTGEGTAWTVGVEEALGFRPVPPARFLRVFPFDEPAALAGLLGSLPLQAVAAIPASLAAQAGLAASGVRESVRVCPPGTLQTPPVEWLET